MNDLNDRIAGLSPAKRSLLELRLKTKGATFSADQTIPQRANGGPAPLSFAQQRLWFLDQLEPNSPLYNVSKAVRMSGALDVEALQKTLDAIVARHEVLRTTFVSVDGNPVQLIADRRSVELAMIDLRERPASEHEAEVQRLLKREARRPFDLSSDLMLRSTLLRLTEEEHVLLLVMHHIASDGWSMGVLLRELAALYEAFSNGKPSPLPELPIQYVDFSIWQRQWLQEKVLENQLSYWKKQLAGAPPVLELPTDRPRPAVQGFRGARESLRLPRPLTEALKKLSQRERVTLFMTLLAAFQTLLHRYTGQEDIVVGSPIAGRIRVQTESLIGFFVNTLVLRTDLSGNPSFKELLARVRKVAMGAYDHQDLPFERLVEEMHPDRNLSHTPLFQVMFVLQNAARQALELPGLTLDALEVNSGTAKFDLTLSMSEVTDSLTASLQYNTDLFEDATINRMLGHFQNLLEGIVANPDQRLSDLPILTEAEKQQLLVEWNDTERDYPRNRCIHHLFEAQVERSPDAVAVFLEDKQLTYKELNHRANQVAHYLRSLGVGPEVLVGICMERSIEMMIGLLGILKAGGAYVPMDPEYPKARLAFMLEDSQASVLLTEQQVLDRLPEHKAQIVRLDKDWEKIAQESESNPISKVTVQNSAYAIYTSGTTGDPKGVMIEHKSLVNYLCWFNKSPLAKKLQSLPVITRPTFDASLKQLFAPLLRGSQVWILPDEVVSQPTALLKALCTHTRVGLNCVPSLWEAMLDAIDSNQTIASNKALSFLFLGGERLNKQLVDRTFAALPHVETWNLYGPTEATANAAVGRIAPDGDPALGHPIANTQIYLLDRHLSPVPVSVAGELHIGGDGLARGYLNRPELTAEKFIPNPFSQEPGARLYKTGDLARYLPDGNIEFLGRTDYQVKIRGFRIELGEIEAVLGNHPALRDAVVLAREDVTGDKQLVAYVVPSQGQIPTTRDLREFLKRRLPDYMMPSAFVFLEALPLTANGKVDRQALPAPDQSRPDLKESFVDPRTPAEEVIAGIWAEVLRLERVGVHDNFFELGGHSLKATQVISRVCKTFQVELPLRSIFEAPTIARLAERVEAGLRAEQGLQIVPPLQPVSRDRDLPLSFSQQRLWFLDQLDPFSPVYNISAALHLAGPLHLAVLKQSLNEIVRRHEVLRTTFSIVDGQPVQVIAPTLTLVLPVIDLRGLLEPEQQAEVNRLSTEEARRPFDLAQGPLLRASVLRLAEEEHVLFLTIHHIVSDAWSMGVLFRELSTLYDAFCAGKPSPLPDMPIQYTDFAVWQRQWLQGKVLDSQLVYWKKQLAGISVLELPTDHPRPPVQAHRGARQSVVLPKSLHESLKTLSQREGVTLFMTLLAAFMTLLSRYTGQDDIAVGTPIAGRNRAETEELIGFFINTLVLRIDLSGNPPFRELLARVRETSLGAYVHQDLPFEKLLEGLQPERDLSRTPLFQVFFNMLNLPDQRIEMPGLMVERLRSPDVRSKFDLTLYVTEKNEGIQLLLVYNTDLFGQARMIELLEQFKHLLSQIVEKPEEKINHFSLVTTTAGALLPNPTQRLHSDWEGAIHALFSQQAHQIPGRLAIMDSHDAWSYEELEARSNQLANYLCARGIQPQDIVAIYGHRSASLVWALLGVLKAGAAFLILDPAYPSSRLIDYLSLAKPRGWIQIEGAKLPPDALQEFVASLSCCCHVELPRRANAAAHGLLTDCSMEGPGVAVGADDLAYVAFTSGSTARPKGVLGRHGPLPHFALWARQMFGLNESDRFSMLSGLSHDPLHRDIFTPLQLGATICIPDPEDVGVPGWLAEWMRQQEISITNLTPAMGQLLTETAPGITSREFTSLRYAFFVGDVLTNHDVSKLQKLAPSLTCINLYGTTETQRAVGYFIVPNNEGDMMHNNGRAQERMEKKILPLGQGIKDVQLLALNASQQLAGIGEVGEIYFRSPHLAKGYMGDDALTQERFVISPFTKTTNDRLYKTGDLARYLPDGNIEFLGRTDDQVKIRGFRIELGEIEAVLGQHHAVRQAVVLAREDIREEKQLVAYVIPNQESTPTINDLRNFLRQKLPHYMLPSAFVMLDALPLTPNGKVDRRALPAPDQERPDLKESFVAPRIPVEEVIAGIWAEVLKLEQVGVHDNFFDLGGHSLLATKLISRLREELQMDLPVRVLFESPTIAQLAARIEGEGNGILHGQEERGAYSHLVELRTGQSQRRIFCFPYRGGVQGEYSHFFRLARHMGPDYSFYGLQAQGTDRGAQPHCSIEELAADYVREIRTFLPHGPYFLLGECAGAPEAYETARQLWASGEKVALLALMDSRGPYVSHRYRWGGLIWVKLIDRLRYRMMKSWIWKPLDYFLRGTVFHLSESKHLESGKRWHYLFHRMFKAIKAFPHMFHREISSQSQQADTDIGEAERQLLQHIGHTRRAYRQNWPRPYGGRITLVVNEQWYGFDPTFGWADVAAGGVEVHTIPGNHDSYMLDHDQTVAEKLRACIEKAGKEV